MIQSRPMGPIAQTAWYCCGARAQDARSPRPVCGDTLAERFMDAQAQAVLDRFPGLKEANVSSAMRHRLIDDALRDRLRQRADQRVLLLGAGFDTRAYRRAGGQWLEGVSMYLHPAQWQQTALTLRQLLPGHLLLCDLIDATFQRRYGGELRRALREIGGDFAPSLDDPAGMVAGLGYRQRTAWSIVGSAAEAGALRIPRWLLNSLLRSLRDGYRVYAFEALP